MSKPYKPPEMRKLPVVLTQEEIREAERRTAQLSQDYDTAEAEKKDATSAFTSRLKGLRTQMSEESKKAISGMEDRFVPCDWIVIREDGVKRLVRQDTGEQVEERTLSETEKQYRMDLD